MDGADEKLFVFYLGGSVKGGNIEVHDIQFVAARKVEEAYPFLARQWFGIRESLHLDAYGILDWADGHRIVLKPGRPAGRKKLFFVNMGGYLPGELREDHQFAFFVAETVEDAKRKAISSLLTDCIHQHRDNLMDVDDCILIEAFRNSCVHLEPAPEGRAFSAAWQGYRPI